ncbi:hypothetical protein MA03_02785 [Infirmifilum uzonense]|uniref:Uncharacterized protein n=1 Tax=Infirmifilum uzonense TaxID=1550241 RepID=A0A0F7CKX3_9CREN|nr:hypothetical protein MA03_02785 [Infirmifilum uzonense]
MLLTFDEVGRWQVISIEDGVIVAISTFSSENLLLIIPYGLYFIDEALNINFLFFSFQLQRGAMMSQTSFETRDLLV